MLKVSSNQRRARGRLLLLAATSVAFALPAGTAGAGGTSSCTFTGGEVKVTLQQDDSSGILSRNALGVIEYSDGTTPDPEPCGTATVVTTDRITIEDTSNGGSTGIILDIRGGHFADGGNEIPIIVDLGAGNLDSFGVIGGTGNDRWTFGTTKGNLQNDDQGEIEFESLPDFGFGTPRGGNDNLCASGGEGTGNTSVIGWVFLGGEDDDRLCGSLVTDRLVGGGGNDLVRGKGGGDVIKGKAGNDRLRGNRGNDRLAGGAGGDNLKGGAGIDTCRGGSGGDHKRRCERP